MFQLLELEIPEQKVIELHLPRPVARENRQGSSANFGGALRVGEYTTWNVKISEMLHKILSNTTKISMSYHERAVLILSRREDISFYQV